MNDIYLLHDLNCRRIGQFRLKAVLQPVGRRDGWTHFSLYLEDGKGGITCAGSRAGDHGPAPVVEGIHSKGGKGIAAWVEVESYLPDILFNDRVSGPRPLELSGTETERELIRALAGKAAPGGHMMFAYETALESPFYRETLDGLHGNFPPVCTPLGKLLFDAGFRLVKDWYLAEGGFEGPRKLWGEKPANDAVSRLFDGRTFFRVLAFCAAKLRRDLIDREPAARKRAAQVMAELRLSPALSELATNVAFSYRDCRDVEALEEAACRTCRSIGSVLSAGGVDDSNMGELERIAKDCCEGF